MTLAISQLGAPAAPAPTGCNAIRSLSDLPPLLSPAWRLAQALTVDPGMDVDRRHQAAEVGELLYQDYNEIAAGSSMVSATRQAQICDHIDTVWTLASFSTLSPAAATALAELEAASQRITAPAPIPTTPGAPRSDTGRRVVWWVGSTVASVLLVSLVTYGISRARRQLK